MGQAKIYYYLASGYSRERELTFRKRAFIKAFPKEMETAYEISERVYETDKKSERRKVLWETIPLIVKEGEHSRDVEILFYDVLDLGRTSFEAMIVLRTLLESDIAFRFVHQPYLDSELIISLLKKLYQKENRKSIYTREYRTALTLYLELYEQQVELVFQKRERILAIARARYLPVQEEERKKDLNVKKDFTPRHSRKKEEVLPKIKKIMEILQLPEEERPVEWKGEVTKIYIMKKLAEEGNKISADTFYRYLKEIQQEPFSTN